MTKKKKYICFLSLFTVIALTLLCKEYYVMHKPNKRANNSITIGIDHYYAPYTYPDIHGKYVGIDIDLAKEACKRIGYDL